MLSYVVVYLCKLDNWMEV